VLAFASIVLFGLITAASWRRMRCGLGHEEMHLTSAARSRLVMNCWWLDRPKALLQSLSRPMRKCWPV